MSWYNTVGPCPEHVLFSKVKYIRNVSRIPFYSQADSKHCEEVMNKIDKLLAAGGFKKESLGRGRLPSVLALAEKQLVDADLTESDLSRFIYLNEPCNMLVATGGRDLISIQSAVAGQAVREARNIASGAEQMLDGELDFSYSDSIGYLSRDVHKCGSGVEFSAALYLPSIRFDGNGLSLFAEAQRVGARLYPMFSFKENEGDVYVLSYTPPYLCDEDAATDFFASLVEKMTVIEKSRERMFFPESSKIIIDCAYRALGILSCARQLSLPELLSFLSDIRLALCLGDNSLSSLPELTNLNFMLAEGQDCSVISSSTQKCLSGDDLDAMRAAFIGKYISSRVKRGA